MADEQSAQIEGIVEKCVAGIKTELKSRSYKVANELRNSSQEVLRGQRSGRTYNVPGTGRMKYYKRKKIATITYKKYTASAPGQPPAVRTGAFRASWKPRSYQSVNDFHSVIESDARTENGKYVLGTLLEEGSGKMAPRPYKEKIQNDAKKRVLRILKKPYNV